MLPADDLTPEAVETLSSFLSAPERPAGTLSYTALRGYLFAIGNSPGLLTPSQWIHRIFGEDGEAQMVWEDQSDAQQTVGWFLSVWNDVTRTDEDDRFSLEWLFGRETMGEDVRREWSSGFQIGWERVEHRWGETLADLDEEHGKWFSICQFCLRYFSDPDRRNHEEEIPEKELEDWAARMDELFPTAAQYYAKLGRTVHQLNLRPAGTQSRGPIRVEKGPGRNDPCPCGSGKKFKKCCMN